MKLIYPACFYPEASPLDRIIPDPGGFLNVLVLDMDAYAEKYGDF